jgi:GLPGLI family protein
MKFYITLLNLAFISTFLFSLSTSAQDFQAKAYYFSKSTMELGNFASRLSEAQKKQIKENLKNRLQKTYVLTFNKQEATFKENEKLDAISGATDSWGKNFSPGFNYKNIKTNSLVQKQEFYGKQFLVKDELQEIKWVMGSETKTIGNYTCFKATAEIPTKELNWYNFSWGEIRNTENSDENQETQSTQVEAWYSPQIPVSLGPAEFWGLPGLILEVRVGNTVMLCTEIIMNPDEKIKIEAPSKGKEVAKMEYKEIIIGKMQEMRDNRGRRSRGF